MSHHGQHSDKDLSRTRLGMGRIFLRITKGAADNDAPDRTPPGVRLGERLGRGQVFAAERIGHTGRVAAKLFPWGTGLPEGVVREFTRDALMVASLHHPHVAQVMDAGTCRDGTPFVLLERLSGWTLEEHIGARGVLPVGEVVEIVRGITSALSAAHAAGIAHRELRADNVFLATLAGYPRGFPKLLDFGVARLTAGARAAGRVVPERGGAGVAPEQRRDGIDAGDPRSDQLALAALAYRLLTGTAPPFGQAGAPAFERLWDGGAPPPWAARANEMSAVEAVLQRAMAWRPEARFDSVASFFRALEAAAVSGVRPAAWAAPSDEPPPRRVSAPAPSLAQQFFAEGDRQEAAAAAQAGAVPAVSVSAIKARPAKGGDRALAASGTFDHVPRRRGPTIAAATLALLSLAAIAWSSWRRLSGEHAVTAPAPVPLTQSTTAR